MNLSPANAFNLDEAQNLLFGKDSTLYHALQIFNNPKNNVLGKHGEKGENAGIQHFSFSFYYFKTYQPFPKRQILDSYQIQRVCR